MNSNKNKQQEKDNEVDIATSADTKTWSPTKYSTFKRPKKREEKRLGCLCNQSDNAISFI